MKLFALLAAGLLVAPSAGTHAAAQDDKQVVFALDTKYQDAVKRHDAVTMASILADDFVLVTGNGSAYTKADLLKQAHDTTEVFEHQDDTNKTVRVWQNTAVVTALLWLKGTRAGVPFDYKLWFSDTYVKTPSGWRYVFGQASLRLP